MSDDIRPGGDDKAWVDPSRAAPRNAFDKNDGYSGQQYRREDEAAQGRRDAQADTPRARTEPVDEPASPDDFSAPRDT